MLSISTSIHPSHATSRNRACAAFLRPRRDVMVDAAELDRLLLARFPRLEGGELPHRLVQAIARDARCVVLQHQRLVDQRRQHVQDGRRRHVVERAHRPDIVQGEPAGEGGQAPEERSAPPAPAGRGSTRWRSAASGGAAGPPDFPREQAEPVRQAIVDLLHGQDPRPDRRELDRERQTVEPPADVHDRHPVGVGQLEPARRCRRPLGEELDRLVEAKLVERLVALCAGQLQRRDRDAHARPGPTAARGWWRSPARPAQP